jgi:Domain of unknown function (DUF4834)
LLHLCTFTFTMLRYILLAMAIYVGYKLLFDIILPVYKASKKIRQQFGAMHEQMQQDQANTTQNAYSNNHSNRSSEQKKPVSGDYIDFEEVK